MKLTVFVVVLLGLSEISIASDRTLLLTHYPVRGRGIKSYHLTPEVKKSLDQTAVRRLKRKIARLKITEVVIQNSTIFPVSPVPSVDYPDAGVSYVLSKFDKIDISVSLIEDSLPSKKQLETIANAGKHVSWSVDLPHCVRTRGAYLERQLRRLQTASNIDVTIRCHSEKAFRYVQKKLKDFPNAPVTVERVLY